MQDLDTLRAELAADAADVLARARDDGPRWTYMDAAGARHVDDEDSFVEDVYTVGGPLPHLHAITRREPRVAG